MKTILLFGAGKSATVLIDYLIAEAPAENWHLLLVDASLELALSKTGESPYATALSFDIRESAERAAHISKADIVISLLPPHLHIEVARDCVRLKKNLLTASYMDPEIKKLETDIQEAGLFFLYEMGLDPGIDHMSAMQLINNIRAKGGEIHTFRSHCGGLVAPESDDNPWHYKISWNPRNIVLAGKAGAHYRDNGQEVNIPYEQLFNNEQLVSIPGLGTLAWYANRDSLSYTTLYGLENTRTFVRTTLRHPDFLYGWNNIIELKLTDETPAYASDGKTLRELFHEHLEKQGFGQWINRKISERLEQTRALLEKLTELDDVETAAVEAGERPSSSFMAADAKGNLVEYDTEAVKTDAAATLAHKMHEANLTLKQLFFLGLDDEQTLVNKGFCSAADILQLALEKKLVLHPDDRDMIVMLHEIGYSLKGKEKTIRSSLVVKGENNLRTAMAKTVGLPLGIAAKMVLSGIITMQGLHIPTSAGIYEPVLKELAGLGVCFEENEEGEQ